MISMKKIGRRRQPPKRVLLKIFKEIVFVAFYLFVCLFVFYFFSSPFRNFKGKGAFGTSLECSIAERETP